MIRIGEIGFSLLFWRGETSPQGVTLRVETRADRHLPFRSSKAADDGGPEGQDPIGGVGVVE